jgi:hypothetical protein
MRALGNISQKGGQNKPHYPRLQNPRHPRRTSPSPRHRRTHPRTIRQRLHPHLGRIARENSIKALAVGCTEDHVHILLSIPATLSVSKAM